MSPPPPPRETSSFGGIYFVLGAVVVALGVVLWLVSGDSPSVTDTPASVTIQNEAPSANATVTPAPSGSTTEPAPATPAEPAPTTPPATTTPPVATSN